MVEDAGLYTKPKRMHLGFSLTPRNAWFLRDYCKRMQIRQGDFIRTCVLEGMAKRGVYVDKDDKL